MGSAAGAVGAEVIAGASGCAGAVASAGAAAGAAATWSMVGATAGVSVAVSGDTLVVGAIDEDSSTTGVNSTPNESAFGAGAAYVFVRSNQGFLPTAVELGPQANGAWQVRSGLKAGG